DLSSLYGGRGRRHRPGLDFFACCRIVGAGPITFLPGGFAAPVGVVGCRVLPWLRRAGGGARRPAARMAFSPRDAPDFDASTRRTFVKEDARTTSCSAAPPEPGIPLVMAEALAKTYVRGREPVRALDNLSFRIERGEFTAIVGPSGSGKTTLLNLLGCLDSPTSGTLRILGQPVQSLDETERTRLRRSHFGFVFQHFGLLSALTVAENVALPGLFAGCNRDQRVADLLAKVGLSHRREHRPHELSGGEMQRTAI